LNLHNYATDIALFEAFTPASSPLSKEAKQEVVDTLLAELKLVTDKLELFQLESYQDKRTLLRAALNVLEPGFLNDESIAKLDLLLQTELHERGLVNVAELAKPANFEIKGTKIVLWQSDITRLKIGSIVNAANDRLLGCFQPLHRCIDNVIHSRAGVQLRDDCQTIMQKQAASEPTGTAKVTRAYNLPSKFVIHTVGPIVKRNLTHQHVEALQKSYLSCLDVCASIPQINSIAFCCISTGIFGYPQEHAAKTAFNTVCTWLNENPGKLQYIVLNVFTDKDKRIYKSLMREE
jgi:O-acetyl-ADP-ribose deacetylase (regulator of RNase III)